MTLDKVQNCKIETEIFNLKGFLKVLVPLKLSTLYEDIAHYENKVVL